MEFLLCVLQYLLIMIVLLALAIGAAKAGISLRRKKDAQKAAEAVGEVELTENTGTTDKDANQA